MSWARNWATRASGALQASGATPLAARSWLTRLNWTPAAPPTPETGGAAAGWAGRTAGRAATRALAGAAVAGAVVGGGGKPRARRVRPLTPQFREPPEATCGP